MKTPINWLEKAYKYPNCEYGGKTNKMAIKWWLVPSISDIAAYAIGPILNDHHHHVGERDLTIPGCPSWGQQSVKLFFSFYLCIYFLNRLIIRAYLRMERILELS